MVSAIIKHPLFRIIAFSASTVLIYRAMSDSPLLSTTQWSSEYGGWHNRSAPHRSPDDFTPTRDALVFAVLRNAPADPNGFTLALYTPNIAIDASGRIFQLGDTDFAGLSALARHVLTLPQTGSFMNAWRIVRPITSQPIERLFVPDSSGQLVQTSVQGFEKEHRNQLKTPVGQYTELPSVLSELFGLITEARAGYQKGVEDSSVIAKVKAIVEEQ